MADREPLAARKAAPAAGVQATSVAVTPPEGVVIRPARPRDAPSYLRMWRGVTAELRWVRSEEPRGGIGFYRRLFRQSWTPNVARLVAVSAGRVIGTLGIERLPHPVNRHVASLGMGVEKTWRHRGVGAALLDAAIRWAEWAGVEKVTLEVYPRNEAAVGLYRKFGFEEEGLLSGHSKKSYGYEDEMIMSRWLRERPPPRT